MITIKDNIKPLKVISKEELKNFMILFLKDSCSKLNKNIEIQELFGRPIAKISTLSKQDGEQVLTKISTLSFKALDNYIRNNLNSDPKEYNRSIILFQSEINDISIILKF